MTTYIVHTDDGGVYTIQAQHAQQALGRIHVLTQKATTSVRPVLSN